MRVMSHTRPENPFEQEVLDALSNMELDGVATNNVLLPGDIRNLPNEHDVIVLMKGHAVTLDAKGLNAGRYRGERDAWEWAAPGSDEWSAVTLPAAPEKVAFRKKVVLEDYVRDRRETLASAEVAIRMPKLMSCIVVPNDCDISGLDFKPDGSTGTGARMPISRLADLEGVLRAHAVSKSSRKPSVEQLEELLQVSTRRRWTPECELKEGLRVKERVATIKRPIARNVYRGVDRFDRPVRIVVCQTYGSGVDASALQRAYRALVLALQEVQHPGLLPLLEHFLTPMALVIVQKHFSTYTLLDSLQSGPMRWEQVATIFTPIVGALRELHAQEVFHRYIDPRCVLVSQSEPARGKLTGFFGASVVSRSTLGAPKYDDEYGAPERGEPGAGTGMSDAYSVARCIIAALTGFPTSPPDAPGLPPGAARALQDMTAHEPRDRQAAWDALPGLLDASSDARLLL